MTCNFAISGKFRPWRRRFAGVLIVATAGMWTGVACAATVKVHIDGVTVDGGQVFVSLCRGGFDAGQCALAQSAPPTASAVTVVFGDVPPGIYGVAAFQDTNGNGALDRSRHGLPLEPYGFSNGAGRTGTPRFERAAVLVQGDTTVAVRLLSLLGRR